MDKLKQSQLENAYDLLKQAESLLKLHPASVHSYAITMSNLASYYKKTGKLQQALLCLTNSLQKETEINDPLNLAATHLNISSIYSTLSFHELALKHSHSALTTLKPLPSHSSQSIKAKILAQHTHASNLKALNKHWDALKLLKETCELSSDALGKTHALTLRVKKSFKDLCEGSESLQNVSISRNSTKGVIREPYKKTPSCFPKQRERLPGIAENRKTSAMSFVEASRSTERHKDNWQLFEINQENIRPNLRRPVQGVDAEKIKTLTNIIKEIEDNVPNNSKFKDKSFGTYENKGILKGSRNERRVKDLQKESRSKTVRLKDIRVKEKISEVRDVGDVFLGISSEGLPVPLRTKVQFCFKEEKDLRSKGVSLIRSAIRMWVLGGRIMGVKKAAVVIQKCVRRFFTRKLFRKIVSAVKFIQAAFRRYVARKAMRVC